MESKTPLKVTVVTEDGKPDILPGEILSLDEELGLVNFAITGSRTIMKMDLHGASFTSLGKRIVVADRHASFIEFEELE